MYIGAFDIGGTKTIVALADEMERSMRKNNFRQILRIASAI